MSWLKLDQTITYWTPLAADVNGDQGYNAGVAISAKWKEQNGIATDINGDDQKITHVVYSETNIPPLSMVVLEDQDGVALPVDAARKVVNTINNPSMDTLKKTMM